MYIYDFTIGLHIGAPDPCWTKSRKKESSKLETRPSGRGGNQEKEKLVPGAAVGHTCELGTNGWGVGDTTKFPLPLSLSLALAA
jgi:hypothetical protein